MATVISLTDSKPDLERVAASLRSRREALSAELDRLVEPPEAGASVAFGKRVGDGTTEAVERITSTATARSIFASIEGIDSALAKIEAGSYGVCEKCGGEIPLVRLEARPESSLCVECARL
jgi:DnaK suppressor protein